MGTRTLWHLIVTGLLIQAGYFIFTYLSLEQGLTAGAIALMTSQQPILIGLLAHLIGVGPPMLPQKSKNEHCQHLDHQHQLLAGQQPLGRSVVRQVFAPKATLNPLNPSSLK